MPCLVWSTSQIKEVLERSDEVLGAHARCHTPFVAQKLERAEAAEPSLALAVVVKSLALQCSDTERLEPKPLGSTAYDCYANHATPWVTDAVRSTYGASKDWRRRNRSGTVWVGRVCADDALSPLALPCRGAVGGETPHPNGRIDSGWS